MSMNIINVLSVGCICAVVIFGCSKSEQEGNGDPVDTEEDNTDKGSDNENESDSDQVGGDTDVDSDTDADGDTDSDTDSDTDADGDTDSDTDSDTDADGDTDEPDTNEADECLDPYFCIRESRCEEGSIQTEISCASEYQRCCLPSDDVHGTDDGGDTEGYDGDCESPYTCTGWGKCMSDTVQENLYCEGHYVCCTPREDT